MNFLDLFALKLREKRIQQKITQRGLADAVVFHDEKPREIPKVVADFFAGKSDAEAERYIALCQSAEKLKNGE